MYNIKKPYGLVNSFREMTRINWCNKKRFPGIKTIVRYLGLITTLVVVHYLRVYVVRMALSHKQLDVNFWKVYSTECKQLMVQTLAIQVN